jgi:hypothetical protein
MAQKPHRNRHFSDLHASLVGFRGRVSQVRVLPGPLCALCSEMLNYATVAITLDTYSDVLPNMQESAAKTFQDSPRGARFDSERSE